MLVLTRRMGERIMVGPDVVITIVAIDRNRVRVGIEAPRSTAICREEVAKRKKEERRAKGQQNKPAAGPAEGPAAAPGNGGT